MDSNAYYDAIQNPSSFVKRAKDRLTFEQLCDSDGLRGAASSWSLSHLFACRVICKPCRDILPLLQPFMPDASGFSRSIDNGYHSCLKGLVAGYPHDMSTLRGTSELQIVRSSDNDSVGYAWAALAALLLDNESDTTRRTESQRRERKQVHHFGMIPSDSFQISSSPLEDSRPGTGSSTSSASSIGYTEGSAAALVEEHTLRFANCFIRCVLNYSQSMNQTTPYTQYRDVRRGYSWTFKKKNFLAIDDGGLELVLPDLRYQVAILEAKRNFQHFHDGSPTVSDGLLAQVVGQVLALRIGTAARCVSRDDIIVIVAIKHFVKLLHFKFTSEYLAHFQSLPLTEPNVTEDHFLVVNSTQWFNLAERSGRKFFVLHLMALIAWAGHLMGQDLEQENPDEMDYD